MNRAIAIAARKEIRALLPLWAPCLAVVAADAVFDHWLLSRAAPAAYLLGSVAIGAASIGHEYTHRTLGLLLSQPVPRYRILLIKIAVLTAMVLGLVVVAELTPISGWRARTSGAPLRALLPLLVFSSSVFLAPAMTMMARSQLAGTVFTAAIPGLLMVSAEVVEFIRFGSSSFEWNAAARLAVLQWGFLPLCALAAVAIWPMFARLSAIEARGAEIQLPRWIGRRARDESALAAGRRQHPFRALFRKELRLQQMSFVVAGLFLLAAGPMLLLQRTGSGNGNLPLSALMILSFGLLSLLIGSLGSAEERQLGTLEWQVLLPVPMWQQWIVKVLTTVSLSLILGVGMPALATMVFEIHELSLGSWVAMVVAAPILTIAALYVSSLSTNGVRALALAIPAVAGAQLLVLVAVGIAQATVFALTGSPGRVQRHWLLVLVPTVAFALAALSLLLTFGLRNHRFADRNLGRALKQAAWIVGALTMAFISFV